MGKSPKLPETDYKQLWQNYSGYLADAQKRFEKSSGIARAKMAQSGIQEGSAAWQTRIQALQEGYAKEVQEIRQGVTGRMLADEFKSQFEKAAGGADFKLAGSIAGMKKNEQKEFVQSMRNAYAPASESTGIEQSKSEKSIYLATKAPRLFLDIAQRMQKGEKVSFSDPALLAQYASKAWGKSSEGTFGVKSEADLAMERAKTAAGGGTAQSASAAKLAEEEQRN